MSSIRRTFPILATISAMLVLILDSKAAIQAAADGIQTCIRTAIPSLFPFFVLSGILVPYASRFRVPWLGRLLQIPQGWESIFLLGCLGGYPVGAQCIAQGYASGKLEQDQAQRMLGFCTNCGPSFLFGIVASAFSDPYTPFAAAIIFISSAMLVGIFWPGSYVGDRKPPVMPQITLSQAVRQAIGSMASVCAWIILGRVVLSFLHRWLLWAVPADIGIVLTGAVELTNGCLSLDSCVNESLRFIIACGICCFGGLCVAMQVAAICHQSGLDWKSYLPQKALQAFIAATLAVIDRQFSLQALPRLGLLAGICGIILILCKMTVEIPGKLLYNRPSKGGI